MKRITDFFDKHKEALSYLFFGVMTTLVNFVAFLLLCLVMSERLYLVANAIAWAVAVIFAYITNKLFVFASKSFAPRVLAKEIPEFVGARVFSFAIEELGLWLMVDILGFSEFKPQILGIVISGQLIAKMILAIIVIVLNYFFSKFIIFHSKKPTEPSPCEKADDSEELSRA